MASERVVIDTNVLVSALLSSRSPPAQALEKTIHDGQLLASAATLKELVGTMMTPKLDRFVSRERRDALLLRLAPLVEVVEILQPARACRDPRDDKFLEVAINGRADAIVTGDRDLLVLHPFRGIPIVTPAIYVAQWR